MKVFRIEKGDETYITLSPTAVGRAMWHLEVGESVVVKAEEMSDQEYHLLPATVRSSQFFKKENGDKG